MSERVVVDPVTRIEGHLRIEAQTDGNAITEAWSSGTMVRGIEIILRGRDPRDAWAFAQRICGVCTLVHGIASVRAVEDALDYEIPHNAQLIRNLMIAAQYVHDHVMHFYHLHALDWVDVVSALKADPKATSELAQSISRFAKSSPNYFADMQKKLKNFYVCCGDRHWQYLSIDPKTDLHEFSCGPASDEHASGTPGQNHEIQPFHRVKGGFLSVSVTRVNDKPTISFKHHDIHGNTVHEYRAD